MNLQPLIAGAAATLPVLISGCATPQATRATKRERASRMDRSKLLIGAYCLQKNASADANTCRIAILSFSISNLGGSILPRIILTG